MTCTYCGCPMFVRQVRLTSFSVRWYHLFSKHAGWLCLCGNCGGEHVITHAGAERTGQSPWYGASNMRPAAVHNAAKAAPRGPDYDSARSNMSSHLASLPDDRGGTPDPRPPSGSHAYTHEAPPPRFSEEKEPPEPVSLRDSDQPWDRRRRK